jgi:TIR domain
VARPRERSGHPDVEFPARPIVRPVSLTSASSWQGTILAPPASFDPEARFSTRRTAGARMTLATRESVAGGKLPSSAMSGPSIFISYAHEDGELARALGQALPRRKCAVWIDEGEMRVGDSLIERIATAIREVEFVVALVSEASVGSNWCKKELSLAITGGLGREGVEGSPAESEERRDACRPHRHVLARARYTFAGLAWNRRHDRREPKQRTMTRPAWESRSSWF